MPLVIGKNMLFYSVDSGEMYGEVDFGHGNIKSIAVGNKYVALCFVKAPGMQKQYLCTKFPFL